MTGEILTADGFRGKDLTGSTFGRLTVVRLDHRLRLPCGTVDMFWECLCRCGSVVKVNGRNLKCGSTVSCGCFRREAAHAKFTRHGRSHTRGAYATWVLMRQRCNNPDSPDYPDYGGRGIAVCERWGVFENFIQDMGECPVGKSINRINNDGNYEPGNCRWDNQRDQNSNRRSNRRISFMGRTQILRDWALETGINVQTLSSRVGRLKWTAEKALTTPASK